MKRFWRASFRRRGTKIWLVAAAAGMILLGGAIYAVLGGVAQVPFSRDIELRRAAGWLAENGGNAKDSAPNHSNGTVSGATLTTYRKGRANSAYSFDGTSNVITVPNRPSLELTGSLALSAWVKVPDYTGSYEILTKGPSGTSANSTTGNYELRVDKSTGYATF